MIRHSKFPKRPYFGKQLESIGMNYWNSPSGPQNLPYWQEGVVYGFSETEVDEIQNATQQLHNMCIEMVHQMVMSGDYPDYFKLTDLEKSLIEQSWRNGDKSLYGRFDLAYGVDGSLKMLEYNGDTPVSILECSVAQWNYIEQLDIIPDELKIQYNLIDETLIETFKKYFDQGTMIHFASSGGFRHEDFGNLVYLMDAALRSGMQVKEIQMESIGLTKSDDGTNRDIFVDLQDQEMKNVFKLYPWEWMTQENFGKNISGSSTRWLEPAWKMLLSNKAMLIKLWEMFPNHQNLLASFDGNHNPKSGMYAKKAIHGREGSNIYTAQFCSGEELVTLAQGSHIVPEYDQWGYMYQQWHTIKKHDNMTPIIGSWIIGDTACGMSIREDENVVTGNNAFFASHLFVPYDYEESFSHMWE